MMKIETNAPLLQYEQPTSKEFKVRARRMICQSPTFGDANRAGDDLNESDDYTYDL